MTRSTRKSNSKNCSVNRNMDISRNIGRNSAVLNSSTESQNSRSEGASSHSSNSMNVSSCSYNKNMQHNTRFSSAGSPCAVLPKLPPAKMQQKVIVKTNIFALEITDRIVYRYDVRMVACTRKPHTASAAKVDLCHGKKDPNRAKKCILLINMALERYRELKEFAYAYDLSNMLFTNQPLDMKEVSEITISTNNLQELQEMFGNEVNISICISECRQFAHSFHTTDFSSSITPNLLAQDHSLRQFYEILTNQYGLRSGSYFSFGYGRLYQEKENNMKLKNATTLLAGVDKSVRFIEGNKSTGLVPALVLDEKKTPFFNEETLMNFVAEVYESGAQKCIPYLNERKFYDFKHCVEPVIRGIRLCRTNNAKTFIANGLSVEPVENLRNGRMQLKEAYKRLGIDIRPDLPAVVLKSRSGKAFFPFEVLCVAPNQKVPDAKLRPNQRQIVIKNSVVAPNIRYREIERHMEALNLSESKFNPILAAFGVRISKNPLVVAANRRVPPQIFYNPNQIVNVEPNKASWNPGNNHFSTPAKIDNFYLFYDKNCNEDIIMNFFHAVCNSAIKRGINFNKKSKKQVCSNELEANIEEVFKESSGGANFIMYVDDNEHTHDRLKLYETIYQVITQHVRYSTVTNNKAHSLENIISKMNVKNFGHNYHTVPENYAIKRWLSSGNTLVVGYDVCHPEPQSAVERRLNLISTQPSVIGFSYNAAKEPETFIGDYAFHEARQEQVTGSILEKRIFHILKLFQKMRNKLPTVIVITRDGVSEGQHKMVMMDELEAIRAGIQNYANYDEKIDYKPKIVLLIAVKRHNKRFFIEKEKGVIQNCLPGTVIDHTVTRVDATEIFIQSHKVIKGTGKIPAYVLLVNEAGMEMDELQAFINALCYSHQIVPSAVSLPEPIYQADEWAKRGRNNFRALYKQRLDELPREPNGKVDWNEVTSKLCYMDSKLELTRSNA